MKTVTSAWWLSDCGLYVAHIWGNEGSIEIDVMSTTGPEYWLGGRYTPHGWHDKDRRHTHVEFAHMVLSWSGDGPRVFTLGFADLDQSVRIQPLTGNAILRSYTARFSRPLKLRAKPKAATP
jgi:hypothetical protein